MRLSFEQRIARVNVIAQRALLARMPALLDDPATAGHHVTHAFVAVIAEDPSGQRRSRIRQRTVGMVRVQHDEIRALPEAASRNRC